MTGRPLLVTATLAGPLAGDAPRLDGLLLYVMSLHHAKFEAGYKVDRAMPAPPQDEIPIPLPKRDIGPWKVGACSDPIYAGVDSEHVDHFVKKISVENAELLSESARNVVSTTNSWTKSYRLPLRVRRIASVRWFAWGERRELLKVLKRVEFLGKKSSFGYGRVAGWKIDAIDEDYSWFAESPAGPVLMSTLPAEATLPDRLTGYRRAFGACVPPYWHPDRYTEIVVPC